MAGLERCGLLLLENENIEDVAIVHYNGRAGHEQN
jgi:hypothetical protein